MARLFDATTRDQCRSHPHSLYLPMLVRPAVLFAIPPAFRSAGVPFWPAAA